MATHGDIGLSQPAASTITMKLRTVTQDVNSTVCHQEVMTIGGGESTLQLAQVLAPSGAPPSTTFGLVTRSFAYLQDRDSTNVAACLGSAPVSTTVALAVRPVGGGVDYTHDTALTPSTVAGPAMILRAHSSYQGAASADDDAVWAAGDLRGRMQVALAAVHPPLLTVALSTAGHSTTTELVSSNATLKTRVYAIQVTSTSVVQNDVQFWESTKTTLKWATRFSSAVMGFNVSVTPPAYLFSISSGLNLALQVGSSDTYHLSLSYFREP